MKNKKQMIYDEKMEQVKKDVYDELYNKPDIMKKVKYSQYIPKTIDDSEIRPQKYLNNERGSKPNKLYIALENNNIAQAAEIIKDNEYISLTKICYDKKSDIRTMKKYIDAINVLIGCSISNKKLPKCIADNLIEKMERLPMTKINNILDAKTERGKIQILSIIGNDKEILAALNSVIESVRLIIAIECKTEEEYITETYNMDNSKETKTIEALYEIWK